MSSWWGGGKDEGDWYFLPFLTMTPIIYEKDEFTGVKNWLRPLDRRHHPQPVRTLSEGSAVAKDAQGKVKSSHRLRYPRTNLVGWQPRLQHRPKWLCKRRLQRSAICPIRPDHKLVDGTSAIENDYMTTIKICLLPCHDRYICLVRESDRVEDHMRTTNNTTMLLRHANCSSTTRNWTVVYITAERTVRLRG